MTTATEDAQSLVSSSTNLSAASSGCNQLENIKVAVRLRPFTEKERQRNNRRIVDIEQNTVVLYNPNYADVQLKKFTFDYSYWSHDGFKRDQSGVNVPDAEHQNGAKYVGQEKVFDDLGSFLLTNALKGYNSALLAYGPTGSGKSYTVSGYGQNEGILPRFARALFAELEAKKVTSLNFTPNSEQKEAKAADESATGEENESINNRFEIYFSMIEIYNEVVRDLLCAKGAQSGDQMGPMFGRRGLKVREHPKHGFFVENLSSYLCSNRGELERRIVEGQLNKSIAATSMNETSSRGHTIYEFKIKQYKLKEPEGESGEEILTCSVVQLVDLAGSERMAVHVTNQQLAESQAATGPSSRSSSPHPNALGSGASFRQAGGPRAAPPTSASSASGAAQQQQQQQQQATSGVVSAQTIKRSSAAAAAALAANPNNLKRRFKESISINQSLSVLGNCIQVMSQYSQQLEQAGGGALKRAAPKIPYRDSALTKLLNRCCLSGNSKVVIIATLSPVDANYEDTLSTLRFADRAKRIRTHATVNRMSRGGATAGAEEADLKRENERLKQMVEGRVARSDDSSQTSNFDDTENVAENFSGSKIGSAPGGEQRPAKQAPGSRGRTTTRRNAPSSPSRQRAELQEAGSAAQAKGAALRARQEQLRRIVSPASRKLAADKRQAPNETGKSTPMQKSRSLSNNLAASRNELDLLDELDLNELTDINESGGSLISPDSEDEREQEQEAAEPEESEMSNEEKIELFNRLLSNSVARPSSPVNAARSRRPRKANNRRRQAQSVNQVSALSSSLKRENPYLSNLNPDEQLTGVITYIIKQGETVLGKSADCDVLLHGPELRGQHAKISRLEASQADPDSGGVFIEPILAAPVAPPSGENGDTSGERSSTNANVALKLNGSTVLKRIRLRHCDRLLFGTNAYFVFANSLEKTSTEGAADTLADLDMVTYEMARNEVLRKVMAEAENEAMIKKIQDYTHRPGTGKQRSSRANPQQQLESAPPPPPTEKTRPLGTRAGVGKFARSVTIQDDPSGQQPPDTPSELERAAANENSDKQATGVPPVGLATQQGGEQKAANAQEANYRDLLMGDTYDYAMPVAEANAMAKELGIKVSYGLKILTGEEQLPEQVASHYALYDSGASDNLSSSSLGGRARSGFSSAPEPAELRGAAEEKESAPLETERNSSSAERPASTQHWAVEERITRMAKLDYLDIPPALFIKVHLDESGLDFYWSKEKFQARRYRMLELYGPWEVGGKSALVEHLIDLSKLGGDYLIDPFVDDPASTFVLIGHAQITLQPLSHLADIEESYDIIDVDDELAGSITIQAIPCHSEHTPKGAPSANSPEEPFEPFAGAELAAESLLEDPKQLLNKKLVILLRIISCRNIPDRYVNVFCQYTLNPEQASVRTRLLRNENYESASETTNYSAEESSGSTNNNNNNNNANNNKETQQETKNANQQIEHQNDELMFEHSHYLVFDSINQDALDFLVHGFLTIQVVGQYRAEQSSARSPTVVSTIISSINKYKSRMEQQQANYNYSNYYNTDANSLSKSQRNASSGLMHNSNSGASSVSTSATVNLFDQQNDDDEGINSLNGISQENIIDIILTKRKLDRAENQLHYLKRTINIAEHYNKKHIPVKTVKKLLNSHGHELDTGSLEEVASDVTQKGKTTTSKNSACIVQ